MQPYSGLLKNSPSSFVIFPLTEPQIIIFPFVVRQVEKYCPHATCTPSSVCNKGTLSK